MGKGIDYDLEKEYKRILKREKHVVQKKMVEFNSLIHGILLGIFGGLVAEGLWDIKNIFIDPPKLAIFLIALAIVIIILLRMLGSMRNLRKEYIEIDNAYRIANNEKEIWINEKELGPNPYKENNK